MRVPYFKRLQASVAGILVVPVVLCMTVSAPAVTAQQSETPQQQGQPSQSEPPAAPAPQAQTGQTSGAQQSGNGTAGPLGTAAAPKEEVTGVMGSRPAGAAIAPAKQRRVRTILIKVGVVVGAGVALGTVAALSKGSPSRPH